jgi:hypothetical protein
MSKPIKKARKPTELNPAHLASISAMKTEMAAVKKGDQRMVQAIRHVAKRYPSARRIEIETVLTATPFKLNLGTVRRQVQVGRTSK